MMNDILKKIKAGEVSGVQFKERILDKYDIACELVAFSNSHGGKLVVHDKSNQVEDLDTGLRYSNTDLDTGLRHSDTDHDTFAEDHDTRLRHSDTPKVSLSNKQRDIVNFCSVPRTTKEILDSIGVCIHSKNREVTSPPLSQQAFFK